MTRQLYDQFAKQYLKELLSPLDQVEISHEVSMDLTGDKLKFSEDYWRSYLQKS